MYIYMKNLQNQFCGKKDFTYFILLTNDVLFMCFIYLIYWLLHLILCKQSLTNCVGSNTFTLSYEPNML